MTYNLFIDDQIDDINSDTGHPIREATVIDPTRNYVSVKSVVDAINYISLNGCPEFISFDFDLGTDELGRPLESIELAKWLIEADQETHGFIPISFNYQVHSKNIWGKTRLDLLRGYLNSR